MAWNYKSRPIAATDFDKGVLPCWVVRDAAATLNDQLTAIPQEREYKIPFLSVLNLSFNKNPFAGKK